MDADSEDVAARLDKLHKKILAGEVTANSELAEIVLPILTKRLLRIFPAIYDKHLIDTAVTDALLNYFENPAQFQENKKSLLSYLLMSARGDLLNIIRPRKLEVNSSSLNEDVEFGDSSTEENIDGYVAIAEDDVEVEVLIRMSTVYPRLNELFPEPKDRELVTMMMNGIRETEEYAKVLGIEHLSSSQQRDIVKRHKDRLKKIITRHINPKEI
jgi:RNA polymerase sigma-70 factor (ECF subfamily)